MPNELYEIHDLVQTDDSLTCNITYDAGHPIFAGHFPNQPIVPGVCTMDMIKELLQSATGKNLMLANATPVKFLQLILPDVRPQALISWKKVDDNLSVTASLKVGDTFAFKMNGVYREV